MDSKLKVLAMMCIRIHIYINVCIFIKPQLIAEKQQVTREKEQQMTEKDQLQQALQTANTRANEQFQQLREQVSIHSD